MWPCVSICVGLPECGNVNKAKHLGEVTCGSTRPVRGTAEKDVETHHGAAAGGWLLLSLQLPWPVNPLLLLVTPAGCGCLRN